MKRTLTIIICLINSLVVFGQIKDNEFIDVVKKLKPISISDDYLRFGAQYYSAKIYLLNKDNKYNYEVTYSTNKGVKKADYDNDYYIVGFMALPGGKRNNLNQFEKTWRYNVRIFNSTHDTTVAFESNYLINLPIVTYNSADTLIAYRNVPVSLTLDYPLYKDFLIDRKIYFYIDSADIINKTDTSISFIPRIKSPYLTVRVGAGGNQIFSKVYNIIEIPEPKIISPNSILPSEITFPVQLEPSDEFKLLSKENSRFTITAGKISLIRNNTIIVSQNINSRDLKAIKKGDTILIHITECERFTFDGKKQKLELNLIKTVK